MSSLPPLTALRAFDAAARHLSFTRAAAELRVTQTAISHQIRSLEAHLGVTLFRRLPRGLLLTDAAQTYAREVHEAFARLHAATSRVAGAAVGAGGRAILTVSVLPSFAARFLVPRLGAFQAREPGIDVHIAPSREPADFAREGVDVGIRFGRGPYPGLRTQRLLGDELLVVCSPALRRRLRTPHDLAGQVLLHDDSRDAWRRWLREAGARDVDAERGPIFTDASLIIQAAVAGQGVALGHRVLCADELAAGRLVRPFDRVLPSDRAYHLVAPRHTADLPKVKAFRNWLLDAIAG